MVHVHRMGCSQWVFVWLSVGVACSAKLGSAMCARDKWQHLWTRTTSVSLALTLMPAAEEPASPWEESKEKQKTIRKEQEGKLSKSYRLSGAFCLIRCAITSGKIQNKTYFLLNNAGHYLAAAVWVKIRLERSLSVCKQRSDWMNLLSEVWVTAVLRFISLFLLCQAAAAYRWWHEF